MQVLAWQHTDTDVTQAEFAGVSGNMSLGPF
jgi:hypothetical protein